ncbi:hypothetical protein Nmel_017639, partial [Mimus melanotis]
SQQGWSPNLSSCSPISAPKSQLLLPKSQLLFPNFSSCSPRFVFRQAPTPPQQGQLKHPQELNPLEKKPFCCKYIPQGILRCIPIHGKIFIDKILKF